jgi:glucose/arabinose dehydrogenase
MDGGKAGTPEPFLTGFLREEKVSGRPVDLAVMPDGALLVSDDQLGVIYRVGYSPP